MFVIFFIVRVLRCRNISSYLWASNKVELLWTLVPAVVLFVLAIPSLQLLYIRNQMSNVILDVKIIGRQWY